MRITKKHRQVARAVWEAGGRLDEVAESQGVRVERLRAWLADPDFRALVAQDALEPLLQATSAVLRWAPVAVARLIRDLDSESSADARQAAKELLRLAADIQRDLARPADTRAAEEPPAAGPFAAATGDPLARQVARLTDDELGRILAILDAAGDEAEPGPAGGG